MRERYPELQPPREASVRGNLQRVVAGIALENLLREGAIAHVGPEIVVVQRRPRLRILILRQQVGAVIRSIETHGFAEMPSKTADIGDVEYGEVAEIPL